MEFHQQWRTWQTEVEEALSRCLPLPDTRPARLHEAMHYSLSAGGKRLRPILVRAAGQLFPSRAPALPAAVAIEFLHTYTLIHDDLPAMDNSPLRRGRPSVHIQYDEVTAILAGDALLTEAFHLLGSAYQDQPETGLLLVQLMGEAAGSRKLIGGQALDTALEGNQIEPADLIFIHENKTAALIETALLMGLATTSEFRENREAVGKIGLHLGLAFQILDDILDATSDEETMGKTVGTDASNGKNTWVSLFGLEASREAAAEHSEKAIAACERLPAKTDFLQHLINKLLHREK